MKNNGHIMNVIRLSDPLVKGKMKITVENAWNCK